MYNIVNKKIILSSIIKGVRSAKKNGNLCLYKAFLFSTISKFLTECSECSLNIDVEIKLKKILRDLQNLNPEICNMRLSEINHSYKSKIKNINNFFGEMATFNLNISGQTNLPPTIGDGQRSTDHAITIVFTRNDFTTNTTPPYNDAEGDAAKFLKIITLPSTGLLKLNNVDVLPNQIIDFTDIDSGLLTYAPDPLELSTRVEPFNFAIADEGSLIFTT